MDLEELRAFLTVAETGSFLTAAKSLKLSRATLRRRIDQLEARAGVLLLDRTRLGAQLTEAGTLLAARGRLMMQEAGALLDSVREAGAAPAGLLRLLLPVGLPPEALGPFFTLVRERYPRLTFRVQLSDDPAAGLIEDIDLLAHFGDQSPPGPWLSRELVRLRFGLLASRDYLERKGTPKSVQELARHDLLVWEPACPGQRLPLRAGGSSAVQPVLTARDAHLLRQLAQAGQGLALVPEAGFGGAGETQGLVPVLDELVGGDVGLRLVVPAALSEIPRIRALQELLRPFLGELGL